VKVITVFDWIMKITWRISFLDHPVDFSDCFLKFPTGLLSTNTLSVNGYEKFAISSNCMRVTKKRCTNWNTVMTANISDRWYAICWVSLSVSVSDQTLITTDVWLCCVCCDVLGLSTQQQRISFSEHVSVINDDEQASAPTTAERDDLSYIDDDRNQYGDLLLVTSLKRWDYPVFELSDVCPDTLLSRVSLADLLHEDKTTANLAIGSIAAN